MGEIERKGKLKGRSTIGRSPDLGYYLIITDTKATEKNYFEAIRKNIPEQYQNRLVISVIKEETKNLVKKAREQRGIDPQVRDIWIIFDRDDVKSFDQIILDAQEANINVGWSNPCIEIWFFSYFGRIPKPLNSVLCCHQFSQKYKKVTGQAYDKADKDIYKRLLQFGNEESAIKRSKERYSNECKGCNMPSKMLSANTIYQLINELRAKTQLGHM